MFTEVAYGSLEDEDMLMHIKMFVLLYGDDTIIMENVNDLQMALNEMSNCCKLRKLNMCYSSNSKVLIFLRGKIRNKPGLLFNGEALEIVFQYDYLGITFMYNGSFKLAIKKCIIPQIGQYLQF